MAISVNWATKVITVPQADLTLVSGSVYELNLDTFRLALKALEDDEDGIAFPRTHNHNTEVSLSGITLARVVEIINGYTVTFEDGQYAVNLVGANSNVAEVTNVNQVSVRPFNSAGLISVGAEPHWVMDQQVYNSDGNLTAARKRFYSDAALTQLSRTVTISATWTAGQMTDYREIES